MPQLKHLVYASSSSVYGTNDAIPFSVDHRVDHPASLYAATKRAGELMAHSYCHLHGIPATDCVSSRSTDRGEGPDMSAYIFTRALFEGRPITVFNHGDMRRDFTWIGDITRTVFWQHSTDRLPPRFATGSTIWATTAANPSCASSGFWKTATGIEADIAFAPMQPGDVKETFADIEASRRDLDFDPSTTIDEGLPRFVDWFREYHGYQ